MIIFKGIDADVSKEIDGDLEVVQYKHFDWLDGNYQDLADIDARLDAHDFPSLEKWDEDPDNPGYFCHTRTENADGLSDDHGEYEVYYIAKVDLAIVTPFSMETHGGKTASN